MLNTGDYEVDSGEDDYDKYCKNLVEFFCERPHAIVRGIDTYFRR